MLSEKLVLKFSCQKLKQTVELDIKEIKAKNNFDGNE